MGPKSIENHVLKIFGRGLFEIGGPWDQIFGLKFFLISSSNDVVLCILGICFAKNAQNQEKLPIFFTFPFP